MPVYLLRAVLTLWLHARLFDNSSMTESRTSPGDTRATNPNDIDVGQWILAGRGWICLPGNVDLLSPHGRRKLLSEAVTVMNSLKSWGISRVYLHLLKRLESKEVAT